MTSAAQLRSLVSRGRVSDVLALLRSGQVAEATLRSLNAAPWWQPWRALAWNFAQLRRTETGQQRIVPPPPPVAPSAPASPPGQPPQRFISFRRAAPGEQFQRYGATIEQVQARLPVLGRAATTLDLTGRDYLREIDLGTRVAETERRARDMDAILARARAAAGRPAVEPQQATLTLAARFAESLSYEVHVPGRHYSGETNQQILEWLEASGRPFTTDTPELRAYVRERLVDVFSRGPWNVDQAARVAGRAIVEWIVKRFELQGGDISLAPLNSQYRAWKSAHGYSSEIGIRTGMLLANVRRATVDVRAGA